MTENTADQSGADERVIDVEQIRKEHRSARPQMGNPAWIFAHNNVGYLLECVDILNARLALASTQPAPKTAQEPFKWCLRIVRSQKHNYATNDLFNTEAEAEKAREIYIHANQGKNSVAVFPLYATPQPFPAPAVQSGELNIAVGVDATNEGACVTVIHRDGAIDHVIYSQFHAACTDQTLDTTEMVKRHIARQAIAQTAQQEPCHISPQYFTRDIDGNYHAVAAPSQGAKQ